MGKNIHIMIMRCEYYHNNTRVYSSTRHINRENFIEIFQIYKFMMFGKGVFTVQTEDMLNFQGIRRSQRGKQMKNKFMIWL